MTAATTDNKISDVELWTHYQTVAADQFEVGHGRQDFLAREIARRVDPGSKLLEIGFGDAYLLRKLAASYQCFAADISPSNIAQMQERHPEVRFSLVDPDGRLPYSDETFDGFIATEVLEHMDNDELAAVIPEIWRVLKPAGRAFLTFPARERLEENESFCPSCGTKFHKWGHKQVWDKDKIRGLFGRFSIETVQERIFPGPNLNMFGKLSALARATLSKVRRISNMTFFVVLRK